MRAAPVHSLPLFPAAVIPREAISYAGFARDDRVELADLRNPGQWTAGRVIAACRTLHLVYVRLDRRDGIVDLNPALHPHMIRHARAAAPAHSKGGRA